MKKIYFFLSFLLAFTLTSLGQNAWINEFHYDDTGADLGEFVEIVIENSGSYSLSDFQVNLYNGSGGASYASKLVSTFNVGNTEGNFTFYYVDWAGIQNGAPDGLSISYQGTLITGQFLSYEGFFAATDGPASGVTSTDIGVSEAGTEVEGLSLQLSGTGNLYNSFTWQAPAAETKGALNTGQTFTGGGGVDNPTSFAAATAGTDQIDLSWVQNANTDDVMVAYNSTNTFGTPSGTYSANDPITGGGTVLFNGAGTSTSHTGLTANTQYFYMAWSVDGTTTYSSGVSADTTTLADEPTTDATSLPAVVNGPAAITLNWTDASDATSYLIKGSDVGYGSIVAPFDGAVEADGALVQNVAAGVGTFQFTGLTPATTYYFQIYPYNGDNGSVNYKTNSPAQASETTATFTPPNVFISEYIEGSSNNKAIEIYNGTGGIIDLADYTVKTATNGGDWAYSIDLSGSLNSGDVYVIANSSANATILAKSNTTSTITYFNGDDAVGLFCQGVFIDGIGVQGVDPGTAWAVAGVSDATVNHTLVRKLAITTGNTDWATSAGTDATDSEWIVFSQDHFFNLGVFGSGWTGATDNDWSTASNWDIQEPGQTVNALINTTATNYPTALSADTCRYLFMESNTSLVGPLTILYPAKIEQDIDAYTSAADGFHFLSTPVSSFAIAGSDFEPTTGVDDFYSWDEAANTWINWFDGMGETGNFEVGTGYLVAYSPANNGVFTGTLRRAPVVKSLLYTPGQGEGWNLLGNPFPSAIDWDLITKTGAVDGSVYVLRGIDNTYVSWNGATGDLVAGEIPKSNGFFVKAGAAGQSVTIELADQVHSSTNFLKSANSTAANTVKISIANEAYQNNTYVQFRADASNEFDNSIDAYKLFNTSKAPQLFTSLSEVSYSINCIPFSTEEVQIPMGFKNTEASEYTISAEGFGSFLDQDVELYLEDTEMENLINLESESYTFTAIDANYDSRFVLHFYGATGIDDLIAEANDAKIYSVDQTVYIRLNKLSTGNSQVEIFNTLGQEVYNRQLTPQNLSSIQLNVKPGIYIVRLRTDNGLTTQKLMIK